jgi:peptidylprolyl isomerase
MDTTERPTITVPAGDPPAELVVEDVVVGDGPEAASGVQANVDYVGVSWSTGAEFDASWNRGDQLSFTIGAGQVISGWDQGVAGMKVGGRRTITIPPHLGYGATGAGGVIAPNETLIFTVDLRSIG